MQQHTEYKYKNKKHTDMIMIITSGQSNLTKGPHSSARGQLVVFARWRQYAPPSNTYAKQNLHLFSHFCRAHGCDRQTD